MVVAEVQNEADAVVPHGLVITEVIAVALDPTVTVVVDVAVINAVVVVVGSTY